MSGTHRIKRGVSLYSYQEEYFLRRLSVEDCIRESAAFGARGIEVIPEQSIPGYPTITDEFVHDWHSWMDAYGAVPVATDLFLDTKRYPGRVLSTEEAVASVRQDLDIAKKLGAEHVRAIINTPPEVMAGAAPYAEKLGLDLLLEIHAPFHYEHPWILRHLDVMDRLDSPALGFMPDMGTFVHRFPRVIWQRAVRDGAREDVVDLIVSTYDGGGDTVGLMDTMTYLHANAVEIGLARTAGHMRRGDPREMLEHMGRIHHIQAKFYEMTDEGIEYSIPYDQIVTVLIEGGYDGYLSSEYEGNRHIQDAYPVDSVDQVRRQHAMLAKLLGETDGGIR